MKWIEGLIVRRFPVIAAFVSVALVAAVCVALSRKLITLDQLSKAIDSLLKALAIIVGALWSLNRYFATRTDYPQLRVDMTLDTVSSSLLDQDQMYGLLSYRLDVVNTGKVLLHVTGYRVELENVLIHKGALAYESLYKWPIEGMHPTGPIEPGSWSAISNAIVCPKDVLAIRVFLDIELEGKVHWTWHRIASLGKEPNQAPLTAPVAREREKS